MSLEEFLSYRPPSNRKILHDRSVDLEWNVTDARDLMDFVLHILPIIEKDKRYAKLYDFVAKKENYLSLYKELDELYDKIITNPRFKGTNIYEDPEGDKTIFYHNHLIHADLLVARDNAWRNVLIYDDY